MGWLPEQGFLKHRWDIYAELTTMYLMAIGSPTHPISTKSWEVLQRPIVPYGGIDYITGVAPLFIHQYPQAWCDYRGLRDKHANYFANSIAATRAHQLWCLVLGQKFNWIDQDLWGISASDSRQGYRVWGGPPSMGDPDGTLVPCACAGSVVFLPAECSHVLLDDARSLQGAGIPAVRICRRISTEGGLVCRGRDRDRRGDWTADVGEPADRVGVGVVHEEPGDHAGDAGLRLPA